MVSETSKSEENIQAGSFDNTEKLIEGEAGDVFVEEENIQNNERRFSNRTKMHERKSSILSKKVLSKHTKSDELHWSDLEGEIKNFLVDNDNERMSHLFGFSSKEKGGERRNTTHGAFPYLIHKNQNL